MESFFFPCKLSQRAEQEGHYLTTVTNVVRSKISFAHTVGHTVFNGPQNRYLVEFAGLYIYEGITQLVDELGMELEIVPMSFNACQVAVETKSVDMSISGFSKTPERAENYNLSDFYYAGDNETSQVTITLAENADKYATAESVAGLKVGAQTASLQYNLAVEQLPIDEMPDIEFITNLNMGATMVATGKIDALITDSGAGELLLANNPDLEMAAFKFKFESEGNCGLVNLDEPELAALIEEALLAADKDIDYSALRNQMRDKAASLGLEVND